MHNNISLIVAMANHNAIGYKNQLLFHLPDDLKRFRELTLWHPIIMGRKTWDSLPKKPLPGRTNIIITCQENFSAPGATVVHSPEEAIQICPVEQEIFIIGGAQIYRTFLPHANKLYITRIYEDFEADAFFPEIDYNQWQLLAREDHPEDEVNPVHFAYLIYIRKA